MTEQELKQSQVRNDKGARLLVQMEILSDQIKAVRVSNVFVVSQFAGRAGELSYKIGGPLLEITNHACSLVVPGVSFDEEFKSIQASVVNKLTKQYALLKQEFDSL